MEWLTDLFSKGEITGNLIAGLLASLVTWALISTRERISRWRVCSRFVGRYEVRTRAGRKVSDEVITIKWIGGLVIEAASAGSTEQWRSSIMLDPHIPSVGRGYFQYEDRELFGRHDIQMMINGRDIYVYSDVPSDTRPSLPLIWRRL